MQLGIPVLKHSLQAFPIRVKLDHTDLEVPVCTEVLNHQAVIHAVPHEAGEVDDWDWQLNLLIWQQMVFQETLQEYSLVD